MSDVDRKVWQAVKDGDRKGTVLTPDVVHARTGIRLTADELAAAVNRLVSEGRLYWRNPRTPRRLLAGHWPHPPPPAEPAQQPLLGEWSQAATREPTPSNGGL